MQKADVSYQRWVAGRVALRYRSIEQQKIEELFRGDIDNAFTGPHVGPALCR